MGDIMTGWWVRTMFAQPSLGAINYRVERLRRLDTGRVPVPVRANLLYDRTVVFGGAGWGQGFLVFQVVRADEAIMYDIGLR